MKKFRVFIYLSTTTTTSDGDSEQDCIYVNMNESDLNELTFTLRHRDSVPFIEVEKEGYDLVLINKNHITDIRVKELVTNE